MDVAAAVFLLFAVLYFLPIDIPHKIVLPLLTLTVFSIGRLPWQMCLAFAFSCIGDLAGSYKSEYGDPAFLAQAGAFAVGHVFFICFFLRNGLREKREAEAAMKKASKNKKKQTVQKQGMYMAAVLALTMIVVYNAMTLVVPCVKDEILKTAVIIYIAVISVMMWSALMNKDWIWGLGAVLFVISDFILAWRSFVGPVPGARYFIMVPYFSAQLILFCRTLVRTDKIKRQI